MNTLTVEGLISLLQQFVQENPYNAKLLVVVPIGNIKNVLLVTGFDHAEGYDKIELIGDDI